MHVWNAMLKNFILLFSFLFLSFLSAPNAEVIRIGAVLPLSPSGALANESKAVQATIQMAVGEINTLNILSNYSLEVIFEDSTNDLGQAFFAAQTLVSNGSVAVIGDIQSSLSINEQYVLREYRVPQISAYSSLDDLSDKTTFPYQKLYTRDSISVTAVLAFVNYMQWTRMIAFVVQGSTVETYLETNNIGITTTVYSVLSDYSNVDEQVSLINSSDIGVVVLLTDLDATQAILDSAYNQNMVRGPRAWIGMEGLQALRPTAAQMSERLGLISVSPSPGYGSAYDEFLLKVANNSALSTLSPLYSNLANHYDAVFAIAYALSQMISSGQSYTNGQQLLAQLKQTSFQGASGAVSFDSNSDLINPSYNIINYVGEGVPKIVGNWTPDGTLQVDSTLLWPDLTNTVPSDNIESKTLKIGLLLPMTGDLNILAESWHSAIMYAINTINSNGFLGEYTISPILKDSQADSGTAILESFNLATDSVLAVIGSGYSSDSETAQLVLRNFKIAQISGSATSDELSNKLTYPTFFRTVPVDSEQGNVLAQIVNYFGWRQVSVMLTDDVYSQNCYNVFSGIATSLGITTSTVQIMHTGSTDASSYVTNLKNSDVLIFLLIALPGDAIVVLEEARIQGLLNSQYAWLTSDGVATITAATLIEDGKPDLVDAMDGLIGTIASEGTGDVYETFLKETAALDANQFPGLSPPASYTTFFYDCMYAYANAFKLMLDWGWNLQNNSLFITALANVSFAGVTGQVEFNSDYDRTKVNFAIVNWRNNSRFEEVATWESSTGFSFKNAIIWPDGGTIVPNDTPVQIFEKNTLAPKVTFILLACLASLVTIIAAIIFFYFRESDVVHATNLVFASFLFIGGLLGYMDIVVNALSPPNDALCRSRVWIPCLGFACFYGALLSKYVHTFRTKKRSHMTAKSVLTVVVPVIIIEIIILVLWTAISSQRPVPRDESARTNGHYVVWCFDSTIFVIITMVEKGLLMIGGIILVIRTGEYPSYYSESYYLRLANWTVIATTCASVALVYILDGDVVSETVVYSVIVLIGLSLSLAFVFAPKCKFLLQNKEGLDSTNSTKN